MPFPPGGAGGGGFGSLFKGKVEPVQGVVYSHRTITTTSTTSTGANVSHTPLVHRKKKKRKTNKDKDTHTTAAGDNNDNDNDTQVKGEGEVSTEASPSHPSPPVKPIVDKNSKEYTGEDLAAHARAAMKQKTSFTFGFDIKDEDKIEEKPTPSGQHEQEIGGVGGVATEDSRTIYVGGLPYEVQDVEIEQYFSEYGQVERIDKLTFSDSGRFNGIAFVTFDSGRSAKKALQANGQEFLEGRYLVVRKYSRPNQDGKQGAQQHQKAIERTPGYHRIYVGNLPWNCTDELLREFFLSVECKIKFLRMGTDKEGNFRGFAHLHFVDEEDMDKALQLNGEYIEGRQVKISPAVPPKR